MDASKKWEYCTLSWTWSDSNIRLTLPNAQESFEKGDHKEVVQMLNILGKDGWEAAGCVGVANWIYWTLKRMVR